MSNTDSKAEGASVQPSAMLGITVKEHDGHELTFKFNRPLEGDAGSGRQFIYEGVARTAVPTPKLTGFPSDGRLRKMLSVIDREIFVQVRLLSLDAITVTGLGPLMRGDVKERITSIVLTALQDGFGIRRSLMSVQFA